jgi:hypothetical protein
MRAFQILAWMIKNENYVNIITRNQNIEFKYNHTYGSQRLQMERRICFHTWNSSRWFLQGEISM